MQSLAVAYDPRRNTLDAVRLGLALLVAVSHSIVLHTGKEPHWGGATLGDLAVDGFFVLSGFLVTESYLRIRAATPNRSWAVVRFGWHRFLRIMPGFWVCLLVLAFVVAPLAAVGEGRPLLTPLFADRSSWEFLGRNAALLIQQYDIAGLLAENPTPFVFDGALWTLALEAACYLLLGALGWAGVLRRSRWVVLLAIVLLWTLLVLQVLGLETGIGDLTTRLALLFLFGVAGYLYRDRIPVHPGLGLLGVVALVACTAVLDNYRLVGAPALAYVVLYLSAGLPWAVRLRTDLSYGVYIYHWPTDQLLMLTGLAALPTVAFTPVALLAVLVPAAASWYGVEKRALSLKSFAPLAGRRDRVMIGSVASPR